MMPITRLSVAALITGFGSVYVNGIRFHTGGTQFSIDDESGVESDLRVGMIVTVKGSKNDDGVNGHATHISYDNELKGPVASIVYDTSGSSECDRDHGHPRTICGSQLRHYNR